MKLRLGPLVCVRLHECRLSLVPEIVAASLSRISPGSDALTTDERTGCLSVNAVIGRALGSPTMNWPGTGLRVRIVGLILIGLAPAFMLVAVHAIMERERDRCDP